MNAEKADQAVEHFKDSWVAGFIDQSVLKGNPSARYQVVNLSSRSRKTSGEDSLFGGTLKTDETVRHALMLHDSQISADRPFGETLLFLSLGQGLNGHPNILHGGMTAMLVDEACGYTNTTYSQHTHTFTANLSVNYRKPIPAPGIVLCRSWITTVSGRKRFINCTVEGPDGILYAECNTLFLEFAPGFKL